MVESQPWASAEQLVVRMVGSLCPGLYPTIKYPRSYEDLGEDMLIEQTDRDPEDLTTLIKGGRKKLAIRVGGDSPTVIEEPPAEPKRRSHKDTKHWCKGVPGRKHIPKVLTYEETLRTPQQKERYKQDLREKVASMEAGKDQRWWWFPRQKTIVCEVCHKHLGWEERKNV